MKFPSDKAATLYNLLHATTSEKKPFKLVLPISENMDEHAWEVAPLVVTSIFDTKGFEVADKVLANLERAASYQGDQLSHFSFRAWRGDLALRAQEAERAERLFREAFFQLEDLISPDLPRGTYWYHVAGMQLVNKYLLEGAIQSARDLLSRVQEVYQRIGETSYLLPVIFNQINLAFHGQDLDTAEGHALHLCNFLETQQPATEKSFNQSLVGLLGQLSVALFSKGKEKFPSIIRIGQLVLSIDPDSHSVKYIMGEAYYELSKWKHALKAFAEVEPVYDQFPDGFNVSKMFHLMSICYTRLGDNEKALEYIIKANQVELGNPFLIFGQGQILEALGRSPEAIEKYNATLEACRQELQRHPGRQTVEDIYDYALIKLAVNQKAQGNTQAGLANLERLQQRDPASRATALKIQADWEEEEGALAKALELLRQAAAISTGNQLYKNQLKQVELLFKTNQYDDALELLRALSYKGARPEEAVTLLEQFPADYPDQQTVIRCLGYAKTEAGWPSRGMEDLNKAVAMDPQDSEAYYLRALTRITFGMNQNDEKVWNEALSRKSFLDSLSDLYAAIRINPHYTEAKRVIHWLVERLTSVRSSFFTIMAYGGTPEADLFKIFPALEEAFKAYYHALKINEKGDWVAAVAAWKTCMQAFQEAGFPILASKMHLQLADVYLRLSEMAEVAYHLEQAENIFFQITVPLSQDVQEDAQQRNQQQQHHAYGGSQVHLELEYNWVYPHFLYEDSISQKFINANYRHRLGDMEGALRFVTELEPSLASPEDGSEGVFSAEMIMAIAGIYRATGKYDQALELLTRLEGPAYQRMDSFQIQHSKGLIYDVKGDTEQALECYEKAVSLMKEKDQERYVEPIVQYASGLIGSERYGEALQVVQSIDIEKRGRSDRDRLAFYIVATYAYLHNDQIPTGLECFEKGMEIVERRRSLITDQKGKINWLGQHKNLLNAGVMLFLQTKQYREAYEVIENGKARALLQELTFSGGAPSEEYRRVIKDLETLKRAIHTVKQLDTEELDGSLSSSDLESLSKLKSLLSSDFPTLFKERGKVKNLIEELSGTFRRIANKEKQLRDSRLAHASKPVEYAEIQALLQN